jgi:hypothetical protein
MCSESRQSPSKDIWSDGTTTGVFHPMTEAMNSAGVTGVRPSWLVYRPTGGQAINAGVEYSNDGITWDTAVAFGTNYPTSTEVYQTTFVDVSVLGTRKRLVRFGLFIKTNSGTEVEICNATMMVDFGE